jgi:type I restriction enzyme S subunit
MSASTARLKDVCKVVQGGRLKLSGHHFVEHGYPAYGAGGLNGYLDQAEFETPAVVLSSIGARCGKCFLAEGKWTSLANTQLIFPNSGIVDVRFLWHQLNDEKRWHRSGSAQPFIKPSDVKSHQIFLPSLSEQRRIAAILDKADALRTMRREAIAKLDQLLQSVFLEMFGDPVTNPKGWPMKHFGEICENSFRNGLSPSTSGSVPGKVLTLSAITRGHFQNHHQKEASFDRPPSDNQRVVRRTFLICRGNGNRQLVGIGAFPSHDLFDVCFPDTMIGADIADHRVRPRFIELIWASRLVREQIESGARTTNGTFKINQKILEKISIPIPPLELQDRFESVSTKLMALRAKMSVNVGLIDENFRSLRHRAFEGML